MMRISREHHYQQKHNRYGMRTVSDKLSAINLPALIAADSIYERYCGCCDKCVKRKCEKIVKQKNQQTLLQNHYHRMISL